MSCCPKHPDYLYTCTCTYGAAGQEACTACMELPWDCPGCESERKGLYPVAYASRH